MNPVSRLISYLQSLPANPCLSLIPNPIITNSSKNTIHPKIQYIQICNSSKTSNQLAVFIFTLLPYFFVFHLLSLLTLYIIDLLSMYCNMGESDRSDRKVKGTPSLCFDPMNRCRYKLKWNTPALCLDSIKGHNTPLQLFFFVRIHLQNKVVYLP